MNIVIEKGVPVRMRDGATLATDVYRPDTAEKCPTLVMRLPYNKEVNQLLNFSFDVLRGVQAGYVVVSQDTRGRYASEGQFNPFSDEGQDGADTIAWAAAQPWSTGAVGMIGGSYFGATQWTAATQAPAALKAIAPFVTTDQYYESWAYQGGAFQLGFNLHWTLSSLALGEVVRRMGTGAATPGDFAAVLHAVDHNDELYGRLPLREVPELKNLAPYYDEWLDHPSYDELLEVHCSPRGLRPDHGSGPQHGRVVRPVPRRNTGQLSGHERARRQRCGPALSAPGGRAVGPRADGRVVPRAVLRRAEQYGLRRSDRPAAAVVRLAAEG